MLSAAGLCVAVFERMPTPGRKFPHGRARRAQPHSFRRFRAARRAPRCGERGGCGRCLEAFTPTDLSAWAEGLGQATFVGTSGQGVPKALKASPLLGAWISRGLKRRDGGRGAETPLDLDQLECSSATRPSRTPAGRAPCGRAPRSWPWAGAFAGPGLGSDGAWAPLLAARGRGSRRFGRPMSRFTVAWTEVFRERFAGAPLKNISLSFGGREFARRRPGGGLRPRGRGGLPLSAALRDAVEARGSATLEMICGPMFRWSS